MKKLDLAKQSLNKRGLIVDLDPDENFNYFSIIDECGTDEFTEWEGESYSQALIEAASAIDSYDALSRHEKQQHKLTFCAWVLPADIDLADPDEVANAMCCCGGCGYFFELNRFRYYTADKETGTFIDGCNSYAEALELIAEYEAIDKADGTYTPDFYDVVNEEHESVDC